MKALSDRVRHRREQLGLSQEQLALRMGYSSRTSINKIENGRPCSQKIIARLADALDVSIPYLMGWTEDQEVGEKEKPTKNGGLPESKQALIDYVVSSVPDDRADSFLKILQALVENGR